MTQSLLSFVKSKKKPKSDLDLILQRYGNPLDKIKMIKSFLDDDSIRINQYLDFPGMDAVKSKPTSGMTILHLLIFHCSSLENSDEAKQIIESIFQKLQDRIQQANSSSIFNPNYPIMNSWKFVEDLDLHMISRKRYLDKKDFNSKKVKKLLADNFRKLDEHYEKVEFDDESGDSEDEGDSVEDRPAVKYKEHLIEMNEFIFEAVKSSGYHDTKSIAKRPLEQYKLDYGIPTKSMKAVQGKDDSNASYIQDIFKRINDKKGESPKSIISDMVVPLFHGVPLMQTQYTNYERREIFKMMESVNKKLKAKFSGQAFEDFTPQEKAFLNPHSRTATASAKLQSLYEMINATPAELEKLAQYEERLLKYFTDHDFDNAFKKAMQIFIFSFGKDKTTKFWEKIQKSSKSEKYPEEIIKYRFPIIAMSKTPDHAFKFGIGSGIEEKRGEGKLNPWYNWEAEGVAARDGFPYHRFAGLIYITLNDLSKLQEGFKDKSILDVNHGLSAGHIGKSVSVNRFKNQHEVDFLGKMSGEVIGIIPILYPYVREGTEIVPNYHQAIYGFDADLKKSSVHNPDKMRKLLKENAKEGKYSPLVANDKPFGKMMVSTYTNMPNGYVLAACKAKGKFPCMVKENGDVVPYNLHFDMETGTSKLSHAHRELSRTTSDEGVADTPPKDSITRYLKKEVKEPQTPQSFISRNIDDEGFGSAESRRRIAPDYSEEEGRPPAKRAKRELKFEKREEPHFVYPAEIDEEVYDEEFDENAEIYGYDDCYETDDEMDAEDLGIHDGIGDTNTFPGELSESSMLIGDV